MSRASADAGLERRGGARRRGRATVRVVEVPYDSGKKDVRMGAGPRRLVEGGLLERLEEAGVGVQRSQIEVDLDFPTENTTAFEVARMLCREIRAARSEGAFPVVLAGNCASCLGTVPGIDAERPGVVWLDSHGDFNTPETSGSGFLDGMALSMLVGDCWTGATESIPGFRAVRTEDVVLVGARDLDPGEMARLEEAAVVAVGVDEVEDGRTLDRTLERAFSGVDAVYLHVDLDVLDPEEVRINGFQAPAGLAVRQAADLAAAVDAATSVAGVALTAYEPGLSPVDEAVAAAEVILRSVLGLR